MTLPEIRRIAGTRRLLVALDFDGTLSPLTPVPMDARMLPAARIAVARLTRVPDTTVALVSGRSLGDLRIIAEHGDESPLLLEASHGAEAWVPGIGTVPRDDDPADVARRDALQVRAEQVVADLDDVWIEPKTFGLAVHTRTAGPDATEKAYRRVDAIFAADARSWRRRTGSGIIEFAYRHEGKDSAIAALRERTAATAVFFAGDDVTDEDAMVTLRGDDVGVRVGGGATAATISVPDIAALAGLLDQLAAERVAQLDVARRE